MTDLTKIKNSFQGLINRDKSLTEEYLILAKICHKSVKKLETLKQQVIIQKQELDKLSQTKDDLLNTVEKNKVIIETKNAQLIQLKENFETLSKQYDDLGKENLTKVLDAIESDRENASNKRVYLKLMKFCTKVFIDGNTSSNIIRGFAANDFDKILFPFEYRTKTMTENEIQTEIWELSKKTSNNFDSWQKLFEI